MSIVTVYSFEVFNNEQGVYVKARGKCTREKIASIGGRVIENTAQDVDDSLLTDTGKYHKECVSLDRFVQLLNEELRRRNFYREGMRFINVGSGYDFEAPMLTAMQNSALDKLIFDSVTTKYTISCDD